MSLLLSLVFPLLVLGAIAYWIGTLPLASWAKNGIYIVLIIVAALLLFPLMGIPTRFPQ